MRETLTFMSQAVRRWRTTGAIAPSGGRLARSMCRAVGDVKPGEVILELGPGTGVFTRELIRHFPDNQIVAVEVNDIFAKRISTRFPEITVVQGCASRLEDHLQKLGIEQNRVAAVVSGLPLLSLPKDLGRGILNSVTNLLQPQRRFVQFTYSELAWRQFDVVGFLRQPPKRVWLNVPPAFVMTFVRSN